MPQLIGDEEEREGQRRLGEEDEVDLEGEESNNPDREIAGTAFFSVFYHPIFDFIAIGSAEILTVLHLVGSPLILLCFPWTIYLACVSSFLSLKQNERFGDDIFLGLFHTLVFMVKYIYKY